MDRLNTSRPAAAEVVPCGIEAEMKFTPATRSEERSAEPQTPIRHPTAVGISGTDA